MQLAFLFDRARYLPRKADNQLFLARMETSVTASLSSRPIIALDDVHLSLGTGAARVDILRGANLDVAPGTSVGLVGPSGSGKSTLLMVLAGLERPTSGTVRVGDAVLTDLSEDRLAAFRGREIGIVFQSFHLIPTMTALENVAVPLELAGMDDPFGVARAELEAVGLGERVSHYPTQLSGGEQQRVAVARALAPKPAILVADEPTGNLDGPTGKQIADLLFEAPTTRGTTLVLVTHDLALAQRCDRQVHLEAGCVVEDTSTVMPEAAE
jgi:putative ABC transport system ATP-binding protein